MYRDKAKRSLPQRRRASDAEAGSSCRAFRSAGSETARQRTVSRQRGNFRHAHARLRAAVPVGPPPIWPRPITAPWRCSEPARG
jgi:hypothetical protein